MKIALVMPKSTFIEDPMTFQPLGLFYLASRLESLGHTTEFYDLNEDELPADNYDEIWVSATSPQMMEIKRIGKELSSYKAKTILGGASVWAHPEGCKDLGYDLLIGGEADSPENIKKILDTESGYVLLPISKTLDWVLPPTRKWSRRYHSFLTGLDGTKEPCTTMFTSRGCPLECIEENQLVLMEDHSWKPIKDIRVGDMVMGMVEGTRGKKSKIEATKVLAVMEKGIKDTIIIDDDISSIQLTSNHKMYANDGNKTRWKLSGSVIKDKYKFRKIHFMDKKNNKEFRRGWLAGYISGDGCIYYSKAGIPYINVTSRDIKNLEYLKLWAQEFGCNFRYFKHNMGNSIFPTKLDSKYIDGIICTKKQETEKFIQDVMDIDNPSDDYCSGWLAGIYDSDGTLDIGGSCRIYQSKKVKPHNTTKIEKYLNRLNIHFRVQTRDDQEGMNIYIINQTDFLLACPSVMDRKCPKSHEYKCFPQLSVNKVTTSGKARVYDITTESHTFICQGYIVHNCAFCESGRHGIIWDRLTRYEPLDVVETQIKESKNLGYNALAYYDDILPLNKKRMLEILELHKKYGMIWRCFLRSDIINNHGGFEYMEAMRDGGLVEIFVGVESADNKIKEGITKKTTIEQDTNIVDWCRTLKIKCKLSFILGLPGESRESMEITRRWILSQDPQGLRIQLGRLIPFAGTPLYKHPENYDLKYETQVDDNWFYRGKMDLDSHSFVSTSNLSVDEIDTFWRNLENELDEKGYSK